MQQSPAEHVLDEIRSQTVREDASAAGTTDQIREGFPARAMARRCKFCHQWLIPIARQAKALGDSMQFILGIFLFVVVIGVMDARLPWPRPITKGDQR